MIYLQELLDRIINNLQQYLAIAMVVASVLTVPYVICAKQKQRSICRILSFWCLCVYLVLLLGETIFCRWNQEIESIAQDFIGINQLFCDVWYVVAAIENVIMFIPFGFLLVFVTLNRCQWWKCILTAYVLSSSIELAQYIFQIGEPQLLDVFMNVGGAIIGHGIALLFVCIFGFFDSV